MKKLGEFQLPTGAKGSIFSIGDILSLVLGGVVLIFTFATAQNFANKVGNKVPGLDGQIEQPWKPHVSSAVPQKQRNVY